jgi:hypothetical protein
MSIARHGFAATLLALAVTPALTMDNQYWQGLSVNVAPMPGTLYVNGVALEVVRISGVDVVVVRERVLAQWRAGADSHIETAQSGPWLIQSRLVHGQSEVLQTKDGELLWSRTNVHQRPIAVPRSAIELPHCWPQRSVHGQGNDGVFLEITFACAGNAGAAMTNARRAVVRSNYSIDVERDFSIAASRGDSQVAISAVPGADRPTLVYLQHSGVRPGAQP